jgi:hypothetical protein
MKRKSYLTIPSPDTANTPRPLRPTCKAELQAVLINEIVEHCDRRVFIEIVGDKYTTEIVRF